MNAAYKWYSHNSNIIQFYSGYLYTKTAVKHNCDYVGNEVEIVYDYSSNPSCCNSEISIS